MGTKNASRPRWTHAMIAGAIVVLATCLMTNCTNTPKDRYPIDLILDVVPVRVHLMPPSVRAGETSFGIIEVHPPAATNGVIYLYYPYSVTNHDRLDGEPTWVRIVKNSSFSEPFDLKTNGTTAVSITVEAKSGQNMASEPLVVNP